MDRDVLAVVVFVEHHEGSRCLRQPRDSQQIELLTQAVDDGDHVFRAIGRRGRGERYHAHGRDLLHGDGICRHGALRCDIAQSRFDLEQLLLLRGKLLLQLSAPEHEHSL